MWNRLDTLYKLNYFDASETEGFYQMPVIRSESVIPTDLIGFNYAAGHENKAVGIHCYLDDYQIQRLWNNPLKYVPLLNQYQCVFSPDYSLYMDMPISMKVWNTYRSRLVGQVLQNQGVRVISTISWAEPDTFSFCFDGISIGSIVTVSTIGVKRNEVSMAIWKVGMDAMIAKINPSMILVYGGEIEYDYQNTPVKYYENKVTERLKELKEVV